MSLLVKGYDLKNVVCTVNGAPISGYGETDAVNVEWASEIAEAKATADGQYVYSRLNDRGMTVTLTISQRSLAYPILSGFIEIQHGDNLGIPPPLMVPFAFALIDPSNGESIEGVAVMMSRPASSKGKTAGEVQFKLHLGNPKVTPAALNVI